MEMVIYYKQSQDYDLMKGQVVGYFQSICIILGLLEQGRSMKHRAVGLKICDAYQKAQQAEGNCGLSNYLDFSCHIFYDVSKPRTIKLLWPRLLLELK